MMSSTLPHMSDIGGSTRPLGKGTGRWVHTEGPVIVLEAQLMGEHGQLLLLDTLLEHRAPCAWH